MAKKQDTVAIGESYAEKFSLFHMRFATFKLIAGGALYTLASMAHLKYVQLLSTNFLWEINFNVQYLVPKLIWDELVEGFLSPYNWSYQNTRRSFLVLGLVMFRLLEFEPNMTILATLYCMRLLRAFLEMQSKQLDLSSWKVVLRDIAFNAESTFFGHLPYVYDLMNLTAENHEPYMCSLSLHMSMFKVFGSSVFAVYNNINSPFKNIRALIILPWLLFDLPAAIMLLNECSWDSSLVYGVDSIPSMQRVFPISVLGAAHIWFLVILPYEWYSRQKKRNSMSAGVV